MPDNPFEPMIKNVGDYISSGLYAQGVIPPIGISNYEGLVLASPADTHLLAAKDPVIDEISVGMTGQVENDAPEPLPDGFIKLEFVQSDGNQYVDTGIAPFNGMGFSCTYYTSDVIGPRDYGTIFGGRQSANTGDFQLFTYSPDPANQQGALRWGNYNEYNPKIIINTKQTVSLINNVLTAADGSTVTITTQSISSTYNIFLHALNNGNINVRQKGKCRIYDFVVYDGEAVYRHYVPCLRESDNKVGYYETVTESFFAPTGGDLIPGGILP